MAKSNLRRWLELIVIPLFVGLIIAIFSVVIPWLFEKDMELSYTIDGPVAYLDQKGIIGTVKVEINDVLTTFLSTYKVRLWNSGDLPLKNVPVRLMFNTKQKQFRIFSVKHETKPKYEFGKINEEDSDRWSKRFVYELLNPKDEDAITFLTNSSAGLKFYAKAEGLTIKYVKPTEEKGVFGLPLPIIVILTIVAALISLLTQRFIDFKLQLPIISWQVLEKILIIKGYKFLRQKGSHRSYYDTNNPEKILVITAKKEIPRGTLSKKIRFLRITREEFLELLKRV